MNICRHYPIESVPFKQLNFRFGFEQMKKEEVKGDPFAILHAPTSTSQIISPSPSLGQSTGQPLRMDSPGPALPPKKSKQPPPRPAPPKNMVRFSF